MTQARRRLGIVVVQPFHTARMYDPEGLWTLGASHATTRLKV